MTLFWNTFAMFSVLAVSPYALALRPVLAADRLADCTQVVEKILEKTSGRLLSFRPGKQKCTVIILIRKEGERPEKIVLQIDRDQTTDDVR
ncbi:hypothetical protein [Rhizobium jaguaris]|uniref:Uncharacterized protein n=1 Tax=Rhizobium jaguaris TaxID=1312183 RepID=A0A387G1A6_9HYPH|nr:hypothetical protein [Rhizobium jaguaris]AYG61802.1 hypothetical protein CCGE525_23285 [Rhizobium jaguaris]